MKELTAVAAGEVALLIEARVRSYLDQPHGLSADAECSEEQVV